MYSRVSFFFQGEILGEINLPRFVESLAQLEHTEMEFGKKGMSQAGYMPHMQSSLSKGFEVNSLVARFFRMMH